MDRRTFFGTGLTLAGGALMTSMLPASAQAQQINITDILFDKEAPEVGNPKGDVTIVEYFDYNCPFCKKSSPPLEKIVKEDGNIRLVYKDWPILAKSSVYGARMALAAKYQDAYHAAHMALMEIPGTRVPEEQMRSALEMAGIDMNKLEADLKTHETEISALIQRNMDQADALGLKGTPVFLIGPYIVPSALDYEGFKQAISDARAAGNQ